MNEEKQTFVFIGGLWQKLIGAQRAEEQAEAERLAAEIRRAQDAERQKKEGR